MRATLVVRQLAPGAPISRSARVVNPRSESGGSSWQEADSCARMVNIEEGPAA